MDTNLALDPEQPAKDWRSEAGKKGAAARKTNSNGWIKRGEQLDVEAHRKRIKVGMLMAKLMRAAEGKLELSTTQVAASKILLDKALPTLQAIEQTFVEAAVTRSEPELLAALRDLMLAHPHLVQQILGEQARNAADAQPSVVSGLPADATQQVENTQP